MNAKPVPRNRIRLPGMRTARLATAALLLIAVTCFPAFSAEPYHGTVVDAEKGTLVLLVRSAPEKFVHFLVDERTTITLDGVLVPLKDVLPGHFAIVTAETESDRPTAAFIDAQSAY